MKKIIGLLICVFLISGCEMLDVGNTPTKKVEEYLNKFQILDKDVLDELDSVIDSKITLNDEIRNEYRDLIKKQYKDMQYTIKEERQNGDDAIVTVEIIVRDFTKIINEAEIYRRGHIEEFYENEVYVDNLYKKYLLDKLKDAKDKVTYTIDFNVHNENGKWKVESISNEIEDKILGIYDYKN